MFGTFIYPQCRIKKEKRAYSFVQGTFVVAYCMMEKLILNWCLGHFLHIISINGTSKLGGDSIYWDICVVANPRLCEEVFVFSPRWEQARRCWDGTTVLWVVRWYAAAFRVSCCISAVTEFDCNFHRILRRRTRRLQDCELRALIILVRQS